MNGSTIHEAQTKGKAPWVIEAVIAELFETTAVTRQEWDDFVLDLRGDIYMTYDWCRIWWRHYGQGRALRLFIFRESGRLVGLAPMFVERVRLGPVRLKFGKRVGADHALSIFSLPIAAEFVENVYLHVLSSFIIAERCDAVWIGFSPGDDPTLSGLRGAVSAQSERISMVRDASVGPHTVFSLPATFDAYLNGLDKRQRQNYRRQLKQLKGAFNVQSEVVSDPTRALKTFGDFQAAHARQWAAEGKLGHFGDWPGAVEFNSELIACLSKTGRFRMVCLRVDGAVVSYQYAFVYGRRCYWRLPARSPDPEFDRFGLGVLGLVQLIEIMIGEGVRAIEAGVGRYEYKLRFGGEEMNVHSCVILANRGSTLARYKLFSESVLHTRCGIL